MDVRTHIEVRGLVQGVGFRWYVQRKAAGLGLSGWVRNNVDGSVEIQVQGDRSLVAELIDAVKVGPRSAQVTDVMVEMVDPVYPHEPFHIR